MFCSTGRSSGTFVISDHNPEILGGGPKSMTSEWCLIVLNGDERTGVQDNLSELKVHTGYMTNCPDLVAWMVPISPRTT